jgi:hypothetical protein
LDLSNHGIGRLGHFNAIGYSPEKEDRANGNTVRLVERYGNCGSRLLLEVAGDGIVNRIQSMKENLVFMT